MYYYGIVYLTNGEAAICDARETEEECMETIRKCVRKHAHIVLATSYITRREKLDLRKILGCPKSRDLMRDKKFVRELSV